MKVQITLQSMLNALQSVKQQRNANTRDSLLAPVLLILLTAILMLCFGRVAVAADEKAAPAVNPKGAAPIMPLADIRVGMTGYGMTVFHGAAIEPFPIEVVSVVADNSPGQGAIWIRCTGERMFTNGLVQGMSGSPIYLWEKGEDQTPGKGGKLIGAFAFGYTNMKLPIIGVQPIEQMRAVAARSITQKPKAVAQDGGSNRAAQVMANLIQVGKQQNASGDLLARAEAMEQLLGNRLGSSSDKPASLEQTIALPANHSTYNASALRLPVTLSNTQTAQLLAPVFEPLGMSPVGTAGPVAVKPPAWLEIEKIKFAPGSVVTVPLAWGDLDISASGTVTDVLPDGRLLGFGHAMSGGGNLGEGPARLPLATGYVHSVMPRRDISFKVAGSAVVQATMIREENAAIIGMPGMDFQTADASVRIALPDQPVREYNYKVTRDPSMTPLISAICALQSFYAVQGPPRDSTLRIKAAITFDDGNVLNVDSIHPNASQIDVLLALAPAISTMARNQHGSVMLKEMKVEMSVERDLRIGSIIQARLDRGEVSPGDEINVHLRIQPFGGEVREEKISLTVPVDTKPGRYALTICDARTYVPLLLINRPHLLATENTDEMFEILQRIVGVPNDHLYVILQMKKPGLAVGRTELQDLPGSRAALIASSTSTLATAYNDWVETDIDTDMVIPVNFNFAVSVDEEISE